MNVNVKALTPDEMSDGYDIIFLMTKQLNNNETVKFLKPKLSDNGVIVTLQNGIPEPSIAEIIGEEKTIGCVVEWVANLVKPGVVNLSINPDHYHFIWVPYPQ